MAYFPVFDGTTAEEHRAHAGKILSKIYETEAEYVDSQLAEAQVHILMALSMDVAALREGQIPTERLVDPA